MMEEKQEIEVVDPVVDPQTETLTEEPVEEISKEEQYEQWVQLAAVDIFGKAVYFDKTVNELLNDIATKIISASKTK